MSASFLDAMITRADDVQSEDELLVCESCSKVVNLMLESDYGAMLIADCDTCRALCCRACLDTEKMGRCVLCVGQESNQDDEEYDWMPDSEESEECVRCEKTFRYYLHDATCDDCSSYFVCKDCEMLMEGCGICGKIE